MSHNDKDQEQKPDPFWGRNQWASMSRGAFFDPLGLPTSAEELGGEAEFSLDGEEKYRSIDILPMPSLGLSRVDVRRQESAPAMFSMELGALNKPSLSSSTSVKTTVKPAPEIIAAPTIASTAEPIRASKRLEAPTLPLDISVFPLEKCHYFTEKEPQVVCQEIEDAMDSLNVVYEFAPEKCKFNCEYMSGYNLVKFVARIFKAGPAVGSEHAYVVEFQRRQGCCLVCGKLFDQIRSVLYPSVSVEGRSMPEPFLPCLTEALVFKQVELPPEQVREEVNKLESCLVCHGPSDTEKEMAKVLIPLSQTCPQYICRERKLVGLVTELAGNCSDEVRLYAICCIANMAADFKDGQENAWFPLALRPLVLALASDRNPHVRREAARALMYMSGKFSQAIVSLGGLDALKKFSECQDRLLHGYVMQAVHNLVSVC